MVHHGAGIILIRKDGAVLMQHRENKPDMFWPDHWGYPAGSVDENEDFEVAARRELKEETDYIAGELNFLIEEDYERTDGETVRRHIFWGVYDEEQEIHCHEGVEMRFLKLEELKGRKLLPGQERLCHLAVQQATDRGVLQE